MEVISLAKETLNFASAPALFTNRIQRGLCLCARVVCGRVGWASAEAKEEAEAPDQLSENEQQVHH